MPSWKNLNQIFGGCQGGGRGDGIACNSLIDYREASLGFHNILSLYIIVFPMAMYWHENLKIACYNLMVGCQRFIF